jgi:two-component system response regulator FlrC
MQRKPGVGNALSVLVVDDDPAMCRMLVDCLRAAGLDATAAHGVDEAVALYREHCYPLIVSDIQMRPRDGFALLAEVKALDPTARVILMSSFGSSTSGRRAEEAGAFAYLTKPFDPGDLIGLLRA